MKYIRTEDGIYKRKEDNYIEDNSLYQIGYDFGRICLGKVIAQADTIEELCDEFVVKHINNEKPYIADGYQKTQILKNRQKVFEYGVEEVKGAIYTNKGLIYVAKLNDKGEFELI